MELAYVYVDLNDNFYKIAVHEMVKSVRRVMPDVKITQISDSKTPLYPESDALYTADVECDKASLCAFKAHFMAEFAMQCKDDLILSDVDILWQRRPEFELDSLMGCLWRNDMPAMPFNTGLIVSTPDAQRLWRKYQGVATNLAANNLGGWYCDQIAAAIAWLPESDVSHLDMDMFAYAPKSETDMDPLAYSLHLKGDRKKWLPKMAKILEQAA